MTTKVRANLSQYHPDYGLTPAEHEKRKAERAAGTRKFESKEARRKKFSGR